MSQAMLFDIGADHARPERDTLDRYYTPQHVADACVRWLPEMPAVGGRRAKVLEGHAGDGAWLRALVGLDTWRSAALHAVDIDPGARGLAAPEADAAMCADFLTVSWPYDAVVGNPPYADAEAHIRHALGLVEEHRGVVGYLLRLSILGSLQRLPMWMEHPPWRVVVLSRRPSFTGGGTDSSDYAFVVWSERDRQGRPPELHWLGAA